MTDVAKRLAERLDVLEQPLAIVLSIHIFVEHVLNRLLEQGSPNPSAAAAIVKDTRRFTAGAKLDVAEAMGLIDVKLRHNLDRLSTLRNAYAHRIDVDLADRLFAWKDHDGFLDVTGVPAFSNSSISKSSIQENPEVGIDALLRIRDVTFGWLYDTCRAKGVTID